MTGKLKVTLLVGLLLLLVIPLVNAAVLFETDFETPTYSTGNLYGQDSWTGDNSAFVSVVSGQWVKYFDRTDGCLETEWVIMKLECSDTDDDCSLGVLGNYESSEVIE